MLVTIINFIKLKNISKRGRVIARSAVGGIFLLLILFALWQRNFADNLIKYVPNYSVVYIYFSQPKIHNSAKIDEAITKILADFKLTDFESLNVNREIAIVGRPQNGQAERRRRLAIQVRRGLSPPRNCLTARFRHPTLTATSSSARRTPRRRK